VTFEIRTKSEAVRVVGTGWDEDWTRSVCAFAFSVQHKFHAGVGRT